jgi:uncharacterized protein (TIGR02118 family)
LLLQEAPMIKVTVLYPNREGSHFDFDYYVTKHMPMAQARFGTALKGMIVERGISGPAPDSKPPYVAGCQFLFDSVEAFYAAFMPHADELQGDIPKYTNIAPVIQISEIALSAA